MESFSLQNSYQFIKRTLSELKHILIQQTNAQFIGALFDNLELLNRVEMLLVYEEFIIKQSKNASLIEDMLYELKQTYRSLLLLVIDLEEEYGVKTKKLFSSIKKSEKKQTHECYVKIFKVIESKMDIFGFYLLFRDFFDIRTQKYFEYKINEVQDMKRIISMFKGNIANGGLANLERTMTTRLQTVENANVLNDNLLYISNSLDETNDHLRRFEEFFAFLNLLLLFSHDLVNLYVTQNFFKYFIIANYFYGVEIYMKLEKEKKAIEFEGKQKLVDDVIWRAKELMNIIVCFLNNIFEIKSKYIFEKKKQAAQTAELNVFYSEGLSHFMKTFIRKTNSAEYTRLIIVKGAKYLMRNMPAFTKLMTLIHKDWEFIKANEIFIKQYKQIEVYQSPGKNKGRKQSTAKEKAVPKKREKTQVDQTEPVEVETPAKQRKQSEHNKLDALISKVGTLLQNKNDSTVFKLAEGYDFMYDDEYDDTLDVYNAGSGKYNQNRIKLEGPNETTLYTKEELSDSEEENSTKKDFKKKINNRFNKYRTTYRRQQKDKDNRKPEVKATRYDYNKGGQKDSEFIKKDNNEEEQRTNRKRKNYNYKNKQKRGKANY